MTSTTSRAGLARRERTTRTRRPDGRSGPSTSPRGARDGAAPVHFTVHRRRRISGRAVFVLGGLVFFVILLSTVSVQSLRAQTDRQLDLVNKEIRAQTERNFELSARLAKKESPADIEERARALGMIDPGPVAPLVSPVRGEASEAAGAP